MFGELLVVAADLGAVDIRQPVLPVARRVHQAAAAGKLVESDRRGGMTPLAGHPVDMGGVNIEVRTERVDQGRFADPRMPGEYSHLIRQPG